MTTTDEATPAQPETTAAPPEKRHWITVEYDDAGVLDVRAHATAGYGARSAAVHVEIEDVPAALRLALDAVLLDAFDDLEERAQDAVSEHRTLARQRQDDHRAPLVYVGPEVTVEDAVYSAPHIMELPADEREAAVREGR